ncbi:hypothetical protein Sinac_1988 [Singulisphaera acidiphila DSM 18658]|uniref:Glycosyltransferase RgtA/B/C/D-like domain-containing protein n=3 Tax=Singulisphaera acidiphila TaxID=466153 RepID=L0DCE9_SINAD|nr:hypothetical protein Sinac_1988 [Singulisphaera acidiphila DSM 18658]
MEGVLNAPIPAYRVSVAVLVAALDLGRADVRVPLDYTVSGDVTFHLAMFKGIADNGWYLENPWLGAPGVMKLYDFPYCENALFLGVKVLTALTGDPFLAGNLLHLATYLMAAWAALFVLWQFGVGRQVAVATSLLFAFLPYHFWHGPPHTHLSNYSAVPLLAMVALWLCAGESVLFRRDDAGRLRWFWSWGRSAPTLAACGLAALSGPNYAYFGAFFLLTSGLIGVLRRPGLDRGLDAVVAAGLLVGLFAARLVPFVAYELREGVNPLASKRPVENYYQYGLRVVNLLKPVPGHRLQELNPGWQPERSRTEADLSWRYNETNEAETAPALGLVGSCGLLVAVVCGLAAPCLATRRCPTLGDLGKLTLAVLLLGLISGFGEMIALYVTTKIRCYSRLSVFVAFFSLFALALIVNRPGRGTSSRRARWGWLAVLWGVTALGLLDQIPSRLTPDHAKDYRAFRDDGAFVTRVEKSLPPGAMIFQLPPNSLPEFGRHFQMYDYSHFCGYLHSRRLRWSYGALRGRETEAWQSRFAPANWLTRWSRPGLRGSTSIAMVTRPAPRRSSPVCSARCPRSRSRTATAHCCSSASQPAGDQGVRISLPPAGMSALAIGRGNLDPFVATVTFWKTKNELWTESEVINPLSLMVGKFDQAFGIVSLSIRS